MEGYSYLFYDFFEVVASDDTLIWNNLLINCVIFSFNRITNSKLLKITFVNMLAMSNLVFINTRIPSIRCPDK